MSDFAIFKDTDNTFTFEVRNSAGSLVDLTTATIAWKIGTIDYTTGEVSLVATGLDGTGEYNVTVDIANDGYTNLSVGSHKHQLVVTYADTTVKVEDEGILSISNRVPNPV